MVHGPLTFSATVVKNIHNPRPKFPDSSLDCVTSFSDDLVWWGEQTNTSSFTLARLVHVSDHPQTDSLFPIPQWAWSERPIVQVALRTSCFVLKQNSDTFHFTIKLPLKYFFKYVWLGDNLGCKHS